MPGRGSEWWKIRLAYARPDLVTTTGRVHERDVVVFEGADPGFVAAAIATYAAEPGRRHGIGTRAELKRLQAEPLHRADEIAEAASTRTSMRRLVTALVLLVGAVAVSRFDGWSQWLFVPLGWFGLGRLRQALLGWLTAMTAKGEV